MIYEGEWSICGGGRLERFYCIMWLIYHAVVVKVLATSIRGGNISRMLAVSSVVCDLYIRYILYVGHLIYPERSLCTCIDRHMEVMLSLRQGERWVHMGMCLYVKPL